MLSSYAEEIKVFNQYICILNDTAVRTSNLARSIYKMVVMYTEILYTVVRNFTHRNVC
jgi:hypothetical protein